MKAIYKREVLSFFHSFMGWLYLAVTFFMMGIYFTVYNMLSGYPTISYLLQSVIFLFLFTVPILTMRSLAEDRKYKTDQLILTAPVSVGKIVMGKYLALVTALAIPVVVVGLLPLFLMRAGEFQTGVSYSALLGFFLYGCLALSIGLFLSSLTESVVVSAVLTLAVLFVGYIMGGLCSVISMSGTTAFSEYLVKLLGAFDMVGRFDLMCAGYFDLTAVLYYVTFSCFMLFITVQSIQKRRYSVSGKGIKLGAYSIGAILLAAVLTITVNFGVSKLPENNTSFDVTANRLYTLTDDTKQMIADIDREVTVYVLAEETAKDADLDKMLQQAAGLSKYVKVSYVSPISNPKFYYNYTSEEPTDNSLIVVSDTNSTVVDYKDIYTYQMNYSTYDYEAVAFDGEGQIAAAISYVLTENVPKFYIISGHGELDFEETYLNAIAKENAAYETLSLYSVEGIPDDAQGVILNAPTSDYSEEDAEKIIAYLKEGGNAFIVPTWTEESLPHFESILEYYGVSMVDGMIVEGDKNYYYTQSPYYLIPYIYQDDATERILELHVFAPFSRGLSYDEEAQKDIYYTPLLETSKSSFSKTDVTTVDDYEKAADDIDGPFIIGLRAEKTTEAGGVSKAYIIATESMFTNDADNLFPGNNMKLFSGIISGLAEHEKSIAVPAKYFDIGHLTFNAQVSLLAGILAIIVIPLCCLVTGFVTFIKRRKM